MRVSLANLNSLSNAVHVSAIASPGKVFTSLLQVQKNHRQNGLGLKCQATPDSFLINVNKPQYPPLDLDNFTNLVKTHEKRLYRFALKHLRNREEADDIAQQTLLEAFRNLGNYRGEAKPQTWLFGIAMNLIRSELAKAPSRRYSFDHSESACEHTAALEADPLDLLTRQRLFSTIRQAINRLPSHMRETFELVAIEGKSYEDAAKNQNISVGTVRSRVSRARDCLRKQLIS